MLYLDESSKLPQAYNGGKKRGYLVVVERGTGPREGNRKASRAGGEGVKNEQGPGRV